MKKVMVVYHSQEFGNTEKVAELVAQGVRQAGDIQVEMINTNEVQRLDIKALAEADGVALGSPDYGSYVAGTIKQVFDDIYMANKVGVSVQGKPCVLFMTHGGGGHGIEPFRRMARNLKLVAEPFVCQREPEEGCPEAVALGEVLGKAVLS